MLSGCSRGSGLCSAWCAARAEGQSKSREILVLTQCCLSQLLLYFHSEHHRPCHHQGSESVAPRRGPLEHRPLSATADRRNGFLGQRSCQSSVRLRFQSRTWLHRPCCGREICCQSCSSQVKHSQNLLELVHGAGWVSNETALGEREQRYCTCGS